MESLGAKTTAELDIIIPCYQNYRLTASCLASIFKSDFPKKNLNIIIIDNASTDATQNLIEYLVGQNEPITYLRQTENLGFVKGNNVGFKASKAPFIMLANNDINLFPDCISEMMKVFKSNNDISIVGAIEHFPNGQVTKEKPFMYWHPETIIPPLQLGAVPYKGKTYVPVDLVGSACCIIKKEVIDKIGVFDEIFGMGMEEQEDFEYRAKLAGFKIAMCTTAHFYHWIGMTTAFDTPYYQKLIKTNKELFLRKWKK